MKTVQVKSTRRIIIRSQPVTTMSPKTSMFMVLSIFALSSAYTGPHRRRFLKYCGGGLGASAVLSNVPLPALSTEGPAVPETFKKNPNSIWNFEPGEEFCVCNEEGCRGKNCNGLKREVNPKIDNLEAVKSSYNDELENLRSTFHGKV